MNSPVTFRILTNKKSQCQHPRQPGRGTHPQDCEEEAQG